MASPSFKNVNVGGSGGHARSSGGRARAGGLVRAGSHGTLSLGINSLAHREIGGTA
jgi:hypothetical protein